MKQNKIYHNLEESPYTVEYNNFIFYFSSPIYAQKFMKNVDNYIKQEVSKIVSKYHVYSEKLNELMTISYYMKVEKRGCLYKEIK